MLIHKRPDRKRTRVVQVSPHINAAVACQMSGIQKRRVQILPQCTFGMWIIIITTEKIKVMLSRKRCRGTLPDYNKG